MHSAGSRDRVELGCPRSSSTGTLLASSAPRQRLLARLFRPTVTNSSTMAPPAVGGVGTADSTDGFENLG